MVGNITRFKLLSNVTLPIESIHEQPITIAQLYRFFRQNRRLEKVSRKGKSFRHMYELPTCYIAPPGTFVNARTVFHLRPPPTLVKARNTRGYFHVHPRVHASEKDISRSSLRPNEIFEKKKKERRNSSPRVARQTKKLFARSLERKKKRSLITFDWNPFEEEVSNDTPRTNTSSASANAGAIRPPCTCRECTYSQILSRVLASIFVYVFSRRWKGDWECREWKREELQVSLLEWGDQR